MEEIPGTKNGPLYSPPRRPKLKNPAPMPPSKEWMAAFMDRMFQEQIMATREDGQREYAGSASNAFGNFERLAEELGIHREKVLWTYAMKHKDGIASWLRGHRSQREDVTGRIKDLIVYLFLLWGMIEQERMQRHDG